MAISDSTSEASLVTHLVVYFLFGKAGGCFKACLDNHLINISRFIYKAARGEGWVHRCVIRQIFNWLLCARDSARWWWGGEIEPYLAPTLGHLGESGGKSVDDSNVK